jgi:acyl-CoA synthetase (AMP-forming)/AMP-acid ligase II
VLQGAAVFKTYGQTEAFRLTSLRPDEYGLRPASVGRAFAGVQVHIAREDGSRAAPNETGEVVHTGLGTMLGYLDGQDPERKLRENPWRDDACPHPTAVFTGDIGYLDEQGFLFLSGRRDDLLKIQGNRVYPNEIRNQIAELPEISAVEVVAVREEGKARLAAFLAKHPEGALQPLDPVRPYRVERVEGTDERVAVGGTANLTLFGHEYEQSRLAVCYVTAGHGQTYASFASCMTWRPRSRLQRSHRGSSNS